MNFNTLLQILIIRLIFMTAFNSSYCTVYYCILKLIYSHLPTAMLTFIFYEQNFSIILNSWFDAMSFCKK